MKARIKFRKYGVMKFIGHLDVMRYFQKAMRRADIPIAFTKGFSPHMIMSFANPLGVGLTSDGEYFDIELIRPLASRDAIQRLNAVMADGIEIINFVQIPEDRKSTGMSIIEAADYLVFPKDGKFPVSSEDLVAFLSSEEILVVKQTKKSEKEVNIRPWILELEQRENSLFLKVRAGSSVNLKPELVVSALLHKSRVDKDAEQDFRYHRLENYAVKDEQLVALDALGTEIL